jgi:hypothetical protein
MNINQWLKDKGKDPNSLSLEALGLLSQLAHEYESRMQMSLFDPKSDKDSFLSDIQNDGTDQPSDRLVDILTDDDNTLEAILEKEEMELLRMELQKDVEEGLLLTDEPFALVEGELVVRRHKETIIANVPNLAKSIIDVRYNQNIDLAKIIVRSTTDEEGNLVISNVTCINRYGHRFKTDLQEIILKLEKIPFD